MTIEKKIETAVFPVAGLGTRFLPATKATPKEMLPVVDKPLIQYAVEEAARAGIRRMVFVTGRNKRAIEDHFDRAYELETELQKDGKTKLLRILDDIASNEIDFIFVRQPHALGLGHAVLCAQPVVREEPFAVLLADDLIHPDHKALSQLISVAEQTQRSVLAVEEIEPKESIRYGIVGINEPMTSPAKITSIVEKPAPEDAPSNLAVVGRYVLSHEIFDILSKTKSGAGNEIQLTDAIAELASGSGVFASRFHGERYDCGGKLGYLKANIDFGLRDESLKKDLSAFLKTRCD
jgi:UTP--glucose-1-phosphate uridylyltransferase